MYPIIPSKRYLHPHHLLSDFLPSIPMNRHRPSLCAVSFLLFHEYSPPNFHLVILLDWSTCRHIHLILCPSLQDWPIQNAKELHIIRFELLLPGSSSPRPNRCHSISRLEYEPSFSFLPWSLWAGRMDSVCKDEAWYMFWLFSEEMKRNILQNK